MATGLLGKAALAADMYTAVAEIPDVHTINIRVINRSMQDAVTICLAICPETWVPGTAPADADYIEPVNLTLPPGGVLEDTGLLVSPGEKIVAFASAATVTVRVHGVFEEVA
jgi:hypothetical protein